MTLLYQKTLSRAVRRDFSEYYTFVYFAPKGQML